MAKSYTNFIQICNDTDNFQLEDALWLFTHPIPQAIAWMEKHEDNNEKLSANFKNCDWEYKLFIWLVWAFALGLSQKLIQDLVKRLVKDNGSDINEVKKALTYALTAKQISSVIKTAADSIKQDPSIRTATKIRHNVSSTNGKFYRIIVSAWRNDSSAVSVPYLIWLDKKSGNTYDITITSNNRNNYWWDDMPLFGSIQMATDFINQLNAGKGNCTAVVDRDDLRFTIIDKGIILTDDNGHSVRVQDLSRAVKVNTVCGPAYMLKSSQFFAESLEDSNMNEDIEKHDVLNPKLFDGNKLKPEVRQKALEIIEEFKSQLAEDEIKINVKDVILTGSNASYNYTKDSDVDLHIIAETASLHCPDNLYPLLYGAYRALFNRKFEIDFYGIPVEIYVESENDPVISNGIYSILNDKWIKEPVQGVIPDIDYNKVEQILIPYEDRYNELITKIEDFVGKEAVDKAIYEEQWTEIDSNNILAEDAEPTGLVDEINDLIADIYTERQNGLQATGEYGYENLAFKEFRNKGYLDNLKRLKNVVRAKELSIPEAEPLEIDQADFGDSLLTETFGLSEPERRDYYNQISQLTFHQPQLQSNGFFEISNVPENDSDQIISALGRQSWVDWVQRTANGFNFNKLTARGQPSRNFTIRGKVKTGPRHVLTFDK